MGCVMWGCERAVVLHFTRLYEAEEVNGRRELASLWLMQTGDKA